MQNSWGCGLIIERVAEGGFCGEVSHINVTHAASTAEIERDKRQPPPTKRSYTRLRFAILSWLSSSWQQCGGRFKKEDWPHLPIRSQYIQSTCCIFSTVSLSQMKALLMKGNTIDLLVQYFLSLRRTYLKTSLLLSEKEMSWPQANSLLPAFKS